MKKFRWFWRLILSPVSISLLSLIITISILPCMACGTPNTPTPTSTPTSGTTPTPEATIELNQDTVSVDDVPIPASPNSDLFRLNRVKTNETGSANIEFADKDFVCVINPEAPDSGVISEIITRPDDDYLFQQLQGQTSVVWPAGDSEDTKCITANPDSDIYQYLDIYGGDPAVRIIVEQKGEVRVAVFRGYVNVAIKIDEKLVEKQVFESEEAVVDLSAPQIPDIRDAVFTPSEVETFLRTAEKYDITLPPPTPLYVWSIPTDLSPFKDERLQKVMSLSINEAAIVEVFPEETIRFEPQEEFALEEYNREEALVLLAEAGFPDGFLIGLYYAPSTDAGITKLVEFIVDSLAEVGIEAIPIPYDNVNEIPMEDSSMTLSRVELP